MTVSSARFEYENLENLSMAMQRPYPFSDMRWIWIFEAMNHFG